MSTALKNFTNLIITEIDKAKTQGNFFWNKPFRTIDTNYRNAFTKNVYKGLANILVCSLNTYQDCRYATFKQINFNGGGVKKGSKSTHLLAWKIYNKDEENQDSHQIEKKTKVFCKEIHLFNVEDVVGIQFEEINKTVFNNTIKSSEIVKSIIDKLGIDVNYNSKNKASYKPHDDTIYLPLDSQFIDSDEATSTAFHEMIHWTAKRVNRDNSKYSFNIEERAMEELVAELGAMLLCKNYKINNTFNQNSLAYIDSWKKAAEGKNGFHLIYKACKLAEDACNYLMENKKEINKEEEELVA